MWPKLRAVFQNKYSRLTVYGSIAAYALLIFLAALFIRPYAHLMPCVICGRVNTEPVPTLYQYRDGVIPQVRDITLWYCQKHRRMAQMIVTKIPTRYDSVWGRFRIVTITGLISLVALFFVLILLDLPITWLWLHPFITVLTFTAGGVTSNLTLTLFITLTVMLPVFMYFIWHQWTFKRKIWK